jgi:CheY-like chemotaxis protein
MARPESPRPNPIAPTSSSWISRCTVIDGYEATRRIRVDPALKSIPIVAVSSFAMKAMRKKRTWQTAITT